MSSRTLPLALVFSAAALFASCGDAGPGVKLKKGGDGGSDVRASEPLSRKIEEFTGNHSRIAWVKYVGGKGDVFANGSLLELWGLDTRDNRGARRILEERGNYYRPMISPDGKSIVFTRKNYRREEKKGKTMKFFDPYVYRVDWEGKKVEKLGPGCAAEVWEDPNTGVAWVYATDLQPTDRSSIFGSRLERFKLYDPEDRELVWDKTRVSLDNIQLSRDGKRASGLFPWPDAGVLDLDRGEYWKNQHGCWPSMAPDDSYVAWVFDGAHKNLHMFTDRGKKTWTIPVNEGPGIKGNEVYHPRWSNHVRYFAITGPYIGKTIGSGVGHVNLYLGKFTERLDGIESWLQLTDDGQDDYFPDLWVASASKAMADVTGIEGGKNGSGAKTRKLWPRGGNRRLLFLWENGDARTLNRAANDRPCSVDARDRARFGPHYEMLVDGGYFTGDNESREILERHGSKTARTTIELVATAKEAGQKGAVVSHPTFQIQQRGKEWIFVAAEPKSVALRLGEVDPGKPAYLAVTYEKDEGWSGFLNGKPAAADSVPPPADMMATVPGMTFGNNWAGAIEGVAIYGATLDEEEIDANYDYFSKTIARRKPIPRVRLKGKLLEMTPPRSLEALDTYQRALLAYSYEVEEVLEGDYEGKNVIVLHYTTMDRKPLQGFPRRPGQTYELVLEPFDRHPQLKSERQWNDLFDPDAGDPYFDISTPRE